MTLFVLYPMTMTRNSATGYCRRTAQLTVNSNIGVIFQSSWIFAAHVGYI